MGNTFTDAAAASGDTSSWITYATLKSDVAHFLGYGVDSSEWTAAQLAEIDKYVQAGVRQFYFPPVVQGVEPGYEWSFLRPHATLDTTADDAAQDLPDDLGRVLGDFFYDESQHRPSVVQVSEARLLAMLSRTEDAGPPRVACVRYKEQVAGVEQKLEVAWWPVPNAAYTLTYRYEAYAGKLTASNPYPLGGRRHAELITESCLAVAEQRADDERGLHSDAFERMLVGAVAMDRKQGARYYGSMATEPGTIVPRHGDTGSTYPITYGGETW